MASVVEPAYILLIDDDQESNQFVESVLTAAGYRLAIASHSAEIIRQLQGDLPDLILVGLENPTTEGSALIGVLRASPPTQHVPVIGISYRGLPVHDALRQPTVQLAKPIDEQALLRSVRRCLEHERPNGANSIDGCELTPSCAADLGNQVVEKLTSETVRIQEEERRKLSLELHDEIAQILGNLILMVDACMAVAPPEAKKLQQYLAEARKTAKEGFRRVQRFSVELRPPILDDLGLAPTILWYAERFTRDHAIPVDVSLPDRLPSLTGEQETALFRIVQESLNNVRKHAGPCKVKIDITLPPGRLRLTVADDGQGFNPADVERKMAEGIHLGLAGMRYRAGLLKGSFEITSAPASGTTVAAEIPLARDYSPQSTQRTQRRE